jgi:NTP pyrophosphatase (non-canonical NTP hydrolase)
MSAPCARGKKNVLRRPEDPGGAMIHGPKSIAEWQEAVHRTASDKGWWERAACEKKAGPESEPEGADFHLVATKIALIHSELGEALEEVRSGRFRAYVEDGKPEGMVVELADAAIRIMDLCGGLGLDLEEALRMKAAYNEGRPYKHGGRAV